MKYYNNRGDIRDIGPINTTKLEGTKGYLMLLSIMSKLEDLETLT